MRRLEKVSEPQYLTSQFFVAFFRDKQILSTEPKCTLFTYFCTMPRGKLCLVMFECLIIVQLDSSAQYIIMLIDLNKNGTSIHKNLKLLGYMVDDRVLS